jgi:hypothetical protein
MLMDLVTLSVVASDVFLRLSHTQTCTLRVGTFGADRGSRGLCTFRVGFGMLSSSQASSSYGGAGWLSGRLTLDIGLASF